MSGRNGGGVFLGLALMRIAKQPLISCAGGMPKGCSRQIASSSMLRKCIIPQFRDKLLEMAAEKSKRTQWLAEKIVALGGKRPEVPALRSTDKNSWQYLLMDLEEENRYAERLTEQIWGNESDHADIIEFLQQISEADKKDHAAIREMLMRSDPFALSLA
jgi:hypothetical protein